MEDLLQHLETRIKQLMEGYDRVKHVSQQLHQHHAVLTQEKEALLTRQQQAISQIESLVFKLKTIEK
jgi:uncharacterized protein (TIGR02449 family)